jgi:DNA polymerase I-like protein with 3'-5' exonuclease and polymerase domains
LDVVYDLESRLLPVLIRMQRRGVRIDFKKLEEIEVWSETQEREQLDKVFELSRIRVQIGDVWKAEVLAHVLRKCEIEVPTKNGKSSVDQFLLGGIKHPVGALLLRARKVNKLRTTFAKSIREHAVNGRIHCTFNQLRKTDDSTDEDTGARYGRVSCTDPNLQQQPARDDFAEMWRSIYVADDGGLWAGADFSQQEPRWTVHFAELCGCEKASVAAQKYRDDPLTDNHTMMARLIWGYADNVEPPKQQRTYAKTIYLGLTYGMGGAKLAHRLGLPTKWKQIEENGVSKTIEVAGPEAQSILDQVNRQAPFLKKLATLCEKRAKYRGWIKTVMGRKCRFPLKKDGKGFDWTHKALNRLIQGSSADQTKKAMVDADEAGHPLQLQVHDELCETVCELKQAHELADIMKGCLPSRVPFRVDVETGPSWGESH